MRTWFHNDVIDYQKIFLSLFKNKNKSFLISLRPSSRQYNVVESVLINMTVQRCRTQLS